MIVIPSYFYSGDVSIKEGAKLTVWVPIGAINNSDDLNFEINLVDVTRVAVSYTHLTLPTIMPV